MRGSQKSLILVARQLGVHIGANDIPESLKLDDRELTPREMCELAHSFDLKAKATKINEKELIKLLSKKQQILRLKNGRYIIALRAISGENDEKSIYQVLLDPKLMKRICEYVDWKPYPDEENDQNQ